MKFVADEGVDGTLVKLLRNAGHDVTYFAETDRSTDDAVILEIANSENRILITRDLDFGELVWRMKMVHTGIILVRAEELNSVSRSKLVAEFIAAYQDLLANYFIVIQPGAARIRKMQA
jgi:predicted nuclease of predicted toxin-antitoxin system